MPLLEWRQDGRNWRSNEGGYLILVNCRHVSKPFLTLCNGIGIGGSDWLFGARLAAEIDYAAFLECRQRESDAA